MFEIHKRLKTKGDSAFVKPLNHVEVVVEDALDDRSRPVRKTEFRSVPNDIGLNSRLFDISTLEITGDIDNLSEVRLMPQPLTLALDLSNKSDAFISKIESEKD